MNLFLDFLFNGFDDNLRIELNEDYVELSEDSEAATTKTTNYQEIIKLISFIYSIPCSNTFTEGVFNHMKYAWTPGRNLMSVETVAAGLQKKLNCQMKYNESFSFVQNEPELIKCARSQ